MRSHAMLVKVTLASRNYSLRIEASELAPAKSYTQKFGATNYYETCHVRGHTRLYHAQRPIRQYCEFIIFKYLILYVNYVCT